MMKNSAVRNGGAILFFTTFTFTSLPITCPSSFFSAFVVGRTSSRTLA